MLLTVSTTRAPATDLGYLLHKHPDRLQRFEQSFGVATVLYPQATAERCTAALVLEVDPVRLARSRGRSSPDFSLAQYVNDRSYASSSLLAVALGKIFSTARSGRCNSRQELADSAIPLEIAVPVLPCRGGPEVATRLFGPLGWQVEAAPIPLDERFPEWGDSRYVYLRLTGTVRLADALNQLYVLLPTLDEAKHYWQGPEEVDKPSVPAPDGLPSTRSRSSLPGATSAGTASSPGSRSPGSPSSGTTSRAPSRRPRTRICSRPRTGRSRSPPSGTTPFTRCCGSSTRHR